MSRHGDQIVLEENLFNDYMERKNESEDVDRLGFADDDIVMVCVASTTHPSGKMIDYYIEGELIKQDVATIGITRGDSFVFGGSTFTGIIHNFAVWNTYFDADMVQDLFESRCNANAVMGAFPEQYPELSGNVNYVEGWSIWSDWTPCSVSCAERGKQVRRRQCYSADEETGACAGPVSEARFCGPLICPGNYRHYNQTTISLSIA